MEDLLEFIISEMYGEVCASVSKCLLQRGDLSLKKLCEYSEKSFGEVRNVLVALTQQNVVVALGTEQIKYRLLQDEVMARLRFPKYVKLAESLYRAGTIVQSILENGSLRLSELTGDIGGKPGALKKQLSSLVESGVLIPVGYVPPPVSENPLKRKATGSGSIIKKLKQEKVAAKAEVERKVLPDPEASSETSFRLNFKLMDKKLMAQLIAGLVETRINHRAALLAEAMFVNAEERALKLKEIVHFTSALKFANEEVMELFSNEMSVFVVARTADTFALDVEKITKILKQQMVEKIVRQHFGENAGRIFLILNAKGFMDVKSLTELTLLPPLEAQKYLNELFRAGILVTQEVPERGLFYGLRFKEVCIQLARNILQGMLNLKIRFRAELVEALAAQKSQWTTYNEIEIRTESALLELERTYMVLVWP